MKTMTLIITILCVVCLSDVRQKKIVSHYTCAVTKGNGGRCTGSAYCRACTNCSRCAHCNSGGSCGVCGGGSSQTYYNTPQKSKKSYSTSNYYYSNQEVSKSYDKNEVIYVYNESINLREGPGLKYKIIGKIFAGESITVIEDLGEWIKVKVNNSENVGFVYAKLLK